VLDVLAAAEAHRRLARGPPHRGVQRLHGVHVGGAPAQGEGWGEGEGWGQGEG
jgi:hypothetical protein